MTAVAYTNNSSIYYGRIKHINIIYNLIHGAKKKDFQQVTWTDLLTKFIPGMYLKLILEN
jgi:hypothetical protein